MADQAPISSRHVYHHLLRHGLDGRTADRLEIVTRAVGPEDGDRRAETRMRRPKCQTEGQQSDFDREMLGVLRKLPGADSAIRITMGQTFTVTWDGIRAPI